MDQLLKQEIAEIRARLDAIEAKNTLTSVTFPSASFTLSHGERFAGFVLNPDGTPSHGVILLADKPTESLTFKAANEWAVSIGQSLPTRQEQALLYANCKDAFEAVAHWSSEAYESDSRYAWYQSFSSGYQYYIGAYDELRARAVRRFVLQSFDSSKAE